LKRITALMLILLFAAIGFVGGLTYAHYRPAPGENLTAICTYEGGTMHDDICVKDGKVLTIDLGGKQ
jgi:hypothetical protein